MDIKYKQYAASIESLSDRKMAFTITTDSVDRDGDTISPKGWETASYLKNPVVLWAHDYSQPPVGKAVAVKSTSNGIQAEVEFLPKGMNPFADMIHDMCKGGFLNATSVGFRGLEFDRAADRKGVDFTRQELLEFSIVPVPSNPDALAVRGVKVGQAKQYAKSMREWATSILGEPSPKMTQEQFDSLSGELAKILRSTPEQKAEEAVEEDIGQEASAASRETPAIDIKALAAEVAKLLKPEEKAPSESEIDWEGMEWSKEYEGIDAQTVADLLLENMKHAFREVAGAQARAAVNRLTGRLD